MNNGQYHDRKSPRATFHHDFSGGDYFVTICTHGRVHYFGEIRDDAMRLSPIGECCREQLATVHAHYPYADVLLSVVMPNHVHAIIHIDGDDSLSGCVSLPQRRTALSVVVGGIKREVTMFARRNGLDFGWQQRFHDHVIRGSRDGNNIAEYIENNVLTWRKDCFHDG